MIDSSNNGAGVRKLTDLLKAVLGTEPGVKAVFLSGSHAIGAAIPGSDVDITVLVRHEDSAADVERTLGQIMPSTGRTHGVPEYAFAGARVCVSILPKHDADSWVDHAFESWEDLVDTQDVLQHKFVEAQVIIDPDGVLAEYRRRLAEYPDLIADEIVSVCTSYLQEEYLDDWGFRGQYDYAFLLGDMLEHIGQALYAKNRRFYMSPLKRLQRDLSSLSPDIGPELVQLVTVTPEDDFVAKRQALESIVGKLRG